MKKVLFLVEQFVSLRRNVHRTQGVLGSVMSAALRSKNNKQYVNGIERWLGSGSEESLTAKT